jgi:hypothetical protein
MPFAEENHLEQKVLKIKNMKVFKSMVDSS